MSTLSRPARARWSLAALAVGLCAAFGLAQSTPAPSAQQKQLDAIVARLEKAQSEWEKAMEAATTQAEAEALYEKRPGEEFLDEIEVLAKEAKGTETAAQAWMKYVSIAAGIGHAKQAASGAETLVDEHVTSPALAGLPDMIEGLRTIKADKREKMLRKLVAESPHKPVQAGAMFALGSKLMGEKKATPERVAEGRALLEKVKTGYTGVKSNRGTEYAKMANGQLFELDHLQIGKAPPDFEVTDENGVKFKLSDYRGKVVVVDFWGNW